MTTKFVFKCFFIIFFLTHCGEDENDFFSTDRSYPSLNNLHQWVDLWKEGQWIIFSSKANSANQNLNDALLKKFSQENFLPQQIAYLKSWFKKRPVEQLKGTSTDQYRIQFLNFPTTAFLATRPRQSVFSSFRMNLASEQFQLIQSTGQWDWIEPDLAQDLQTARFSSKTPLPKSQDLKEAQNSQGILSQIPSELIKRNNEILERINLLKAREQVTQEMRAQESSLTEVHIAVLDTGVDALHPYLINRMFIHPKYDEPGHVLRHGLNAAAYQKGLPGEDPGSGPVSGSGNACLRQYDVGDARAEDCLHGTHVAGLIGADFGLGACSSCKIISIRVSNRIPILDESQNYLYSVDGSIQDSSQIRGLNYLYNLRWPDQPNRLITNAVNMSLGKIFWSRTMAFLIRQLTSFDVAVFGAAGNENISIATFPAAYETVMGIAALGDRADLGYRGPYGKATFSNFGTWVDLSAPGTQITSTIPGMIDKVGLYDTISGTSMATPIVAGCFGFLKSYFGNRISSLELQKRMLLSANYKKVYNAEYNLNTYKQIFSKNLAVTMLGAGIVDVLATLNDVVQSDFNRNIDENITGGCVLSQLNSSRGLRQSDHLFCLLVFLFFILKRYYQRKKEKNFNF
jgi:hypothetical protein